jgi:hypothetical protein
VVAAKLELGLKRPPPRGRFGQAPSRLTTSRDRPPSKVIRRAEEIISIELIRRNVFRRNGLRRCAGREHLDCAPATLCPRSAPWCPSTRANTRRTCHFFWPYGVDTSGAFNAFQRHMANVTRAAHSLTQVRKWAGLVHRRLLMRRQPVESDFEVKASEATIEVFFRPTVSNYTFQRFADARDITEFGPLSPDPGVRHGRPAAPATISPPKFKPWHFAWPDDRDKPGCPRVG